MKSSCPVRSEQPFHQCLKKQEASYECCNTATDSSCLSICKAVFTQNSPLTMAQNTSLIEQCPPKISECVHNYTKLNRPPDPSESLPCCNASTDDVCRQKCQVSLTTLKDESDIVDSLIAHCGIPMMSQNEALWTCLLKMSDTGTNSESGQPNTPHGTIEKAGMDGAKLHCCQKAVTSKCRTLCSETHGKEFLSNWESFDGQCRRFSPSETELNKCLDEVSEPCTLGCPTLQFCSNFNHRPTEMFRSCNKQAEEAAKLTLQNWSKGVINLPFMEHIPVKDINTCHPDWWKAIACAIQIKPCNPHHQITRICYKDCVRILSHCLDRTKLMPGVTHTSLCQKLAPVEGEEEHCIELEKYVSESPMKLYNEEVSHPCVPNPCNNTGMCKVIKTSNCKGAFCPKYQCEPGCRLGEVSSVYTPVQSFVRLPIASKLHCHRVCQCGQQGLLTKCQEMECSKQAHCHVGSGRIHNHNTKFELDCNECLCHNGEIICTKHECYSHTKHSIKGYTGLPCNCDTRYIPVCGENGHTYWNPCLARCSQIGDGKFKLGECQTHNPCKQNNCNGNEVCVPRFQKCLHHTKCQQYQCLNVNKDCSDPSVVDPVCGSDGVEYQNLCSLLQSSSEVVQVAYWGHCKQGCIYNSSVVCGMDRENYPSECHAWAANVMVDYYGHCHVTPALVGKQESAQYQCESVICPDLSTKQFCEPIKPIGVCCHVCASEIRVLYSKNLINSMMDNNLGLVYTIHDIAKALARQLSTAECDVFAYVSLEQDLTLLVGATTSSPTLAQVEACMMEADKLTQLIDTRASAIQVVAVTSPLLSARLTQPQTNRVAYSGAYSSGAASTTLSLLSFQVIFLSSMSYYLWVV